MKFGSCLKCDFYKKVVKEEGRDIASARLIDEQLEIRGAGRNSR
jgi:hypothetical protein